MCCLSILREWNASSASLLTILIWEVLLTPWQEALQRGLCKTERCHEIQQRYCVLLLGWHNTKEAQAGRQKAGGQLSRKGAGSVGWQQAQHEPAACPSSQECKLHFGVHLTQHSQQVKTGDSLSIFSTSVALPWVPWEWVSRTLVQVCNNRAMNASCHGLICYSLLQLVSITVSY